jgi:hypothetical protein
VLSFFLRAFVIGVVDYGRCRMHVKGAPAKSSLFVSCLALAAVLVLGLASSARAANLAPNPGFETACGNIPCNWTSTTGSTILRVPNAPHSGAASLRVIATGTTTIVTALSDCFAVTAGTTYQLRLWYLAAPPVTISQITFGATFFSGANCTGSLQSPAGAAANSPIIDGAWHLITGQTTATSGMPFNAQSARIQINFVCSLMTCLVAPGSQLFDAVQYDDVVFDPDLLAVTVHSLTARRTHKGVVVRWRTGSEVDTLGFNVYRQRGARRVRLNRRVIPALSLTRGVSGGNYSYVDRNAPRHRPLRYWLQEVAPNGARTWHGSVRVSAT